MQSFQEEKRRKLQVADHKYSNSSPKNLKKYKGVWVLGLVGYESFWSPQQESSDVNQAPYQIAANLKADHSNNSQHHHTRKILLDDTRLEGPS